MNSGNDSRSVARYLSSNNVSFPTIVDTNRQFEKAAIDTEIDLGNIWRTYVMDGEGNLRSCAPTKDGMKRALDAVLQTVSWNVDPELIPDDMKEAWQAVEFGNYAVAAKTVQKALRSRNEETQSGAEALNDFVQGKLEALATRAAELNEGEKHWESYKAYTELDAKYSGYLDDSINTKKILNELKSSKQVKSELSAMKQLQSASTVAARSGFKKVVGRLTKLIEKYPGTEAAETAEKLLAENSAD